MVKEHSSYRGWALGKTIFKYSVFGCLAKKYSSKPIIIGIARILYESRSGSVFENKRHSLYDLLVGMGVKQVSMQISKNVIVILFSLAIPMFLFLAPVISTSYPPPNYYSSPCTYGCFDFHAYGSITYYLFGIGGISVSGLGYFFRS